MQVRAGAGGGEAALWAADLMRMYQRYALEQGWKMSEVNSSEGDSGGYKEIVMQASLRPMLRGPCPSTGRLLLLLACVGLMASQLAL